LKDLWAPSQGCDGRFQISKQVDNPDTKDGQNRDTSEDENGISHDTEMGVLLNFHLKEYQVVSSQ
jgi:hypothetical protein